MRSAPVLFALSLLAAYGTQYRGRDVTIITQQQFEPSRYLDTSYETARFPVPVPFQERCTATTATYQQVDADTVSVLNRCGDGSPDGPFAFINGTAHRRGKWAR